MENNLTDRSFWKSFWESSKGLIFKMKPNYVFGDILAKIIADKGVKMLLSWVVSRGIMLSTLKSIST
jgi:hypothetical protein